MSQVLKHHKHKMDHEVESIKLIATDSWDITTFDEDDVEVYLNGRSFVVIPQAAGFGNIHHRKNITKHFAELTPRNSR